MSECTDKQIARMLLAYELGMLSEEDRQKVEMHLMKCPVCFDKAKEFQPMSQLIREDPEASSCIRELAEKETDLSNVTISKRRTWGWKRYGSAVALAAAVVLMFLLTPWQFEFHPEHEAVAAQDVLLIMNFEDANEGDRLGETVASLLITDLSESDYVRIISRERLSDLSRLVKQEGSVSDTISLVGGLADLAGARWVLRGEVFRDQQSTVITSRLLEMPGAEVVATQKVTGLGNESVFGLVDRLTSLIKHDLPLPGAALEEVDPAVADVTTHSPEAYLHYLEGVDYHKKVYTPEAISSFEKCLAIDSTYAMAYYYLAGLKNGELILKASELMHRAGRKEQYYIRSRVADYLQDENGSIKILEELLERYPNEKDAIYMLGNQAFNQRDYREAIRRFSDVLLIDPLHRQASNGLAYSYDAIGELDNALETINSYIRIAPNEANPYDSRGDLYARNGFPEQALASYQAALSKKPDFAASVENVGHMYTFQGKYAEAYRFYDEAISLTAFPNLSTSLLNPALIFIRQGRLSQALVAIDTAIAHYREAAARTQTQPTTWPHYLKAKVLHELGEVRLAADEARTCIRMSDQISSANEISYRWTLAHYLAELGDNRQADSLLRVVERAWRRNPIIPTAYYWAAGMVAHARGDDETAVLMLEKTAELFSPGTGFKEYCVLGRAYNEVDRYDDAIRVLEPITRNYTGHRLFDGILGVKVHYYLGQAYESTGRDELAIEQYTLFLDIWKDADPDIEEIAEARMRLARLTSPG